MSPEDWGVTRIILSVGIGLGALCLSFAAFLQVWRYQRGKASAKELAELLSTIGWMLTYGGITAVGSAFGEHSRAQGMFMALLLIAALVWMLIRTYDAVRRIRLSRENASLSYYTKLVAWMVFVVLGLTLFAVGAIRLLSQAGRMQVVIVFAGILIGLVVAWLQTTFQERDSHSGPEDTDKVTIIKAG